VSFITVGFAAEPWVGFPSVITFDVRVLFFKTSAVSSASSGNGLFLPLSRSPDSFLLVPFAETFVLLVFFLLVDLVAILLIAIR